MLAEGHSKSNSQHSFYNLSFELQICCHFLNLYTYVWQWASGWNDKGRAEYALMQAYLQKKNSLLLFFLLSTLLDVALVNVVQPNASVRPIVYTVSIIIRSFFLSFWSWETKIVPTSFSFSLFPVVLLTLSISPQSSLLPPPLYKRISCAERRKKPTVFVSWAF